MTTIMPPLRQGLSPSSLTQPGLHLFSSGITGVHPDFFMWVLGGPCVCVADMLLMELSPSPRL